MGLKDIFKKKQEKSDLQISPYIIEKFGLNNEYISSSEGKALLSVTENILLVFKQVAHERSERNEIEVKNIITFNSSTIGLPNKVGSDLEKSIEFLINKGILTIDTAGDYQLTSPGKDFYLVYLKNIDYFNKEFTRRDIYGG